jgi:hypothetical protein
VAWSCAAARAVRTIEEPMAALTRGLREAAAMQKSVQAMVGARKIGQQEVSMPEPPKRRVSVRALESIEVRWWRWCWSDPQRL